MRNDTFSRLLFLFLSLMLIQGIGCGGAKTVYRKVRPLGGELRKRVLVLPVKDQAGLGEGKAAQMNDTFVGLLREDGHFLVHEASNPTPSIKEMRSSALGMTVDPDLAKHAEEMGMNVLITAVLHPFESAFKKAGIWPLRKLRREFEVSMSVNALDLVNGTLFFTHTETKKIKMPEDVSEWEENIETANEIINNDQLEQVLSSLMVRLTTAVTEDLIGQPWFGRILRVDGQTITIHAGKDIGLMQGRIFEVFGRGDPIRAASGATLYLLGPKVGEIKIVGVMETKASAAPVMGGPFSTGQVIRAKK